MALISPNLLKIRQNRTAKPLYARTQATPQAAFLAEDWDESVDIYPGSVLTSLGKGIVTLCDASATPAGLSGNFCAPKLGFNEVTNDYGREITLWVMTPAAQLEITAPAFDDAADWAGAEADLEAMKAVFLKSNADGLLTIDGNAATPLSVAQLVSVEGTNQIIVSGLKNV